MATPGPGSSTQSTLEKMREIQARGQSFSPALPSPGATAPDFCLAASRFMVGKLVGLYPPSRHLNDFLKSSEASAKKVGLDRVAVRFAFGVLGAPKSRPDLAPLKDFNRKVLPASIKWGRTGQGPDGEAIAPGDVEFTYEQGDPANGDKLLAQRVPLVVGVSLDASGSRDHFIALAPDSTGDIWAIDPWDSSTFASVVKLPAGTTLVKGVTVSMNAGRTVIPCKKPFVGYFRSRKDKSPLVVK